MDFLKVVLGCLVGASPLLAHGDNSVKKTEVPLTSWAIDSTNQQQLDTVAKRFEIVSRKGSVYEVYVPANQIAAFRMMAPQAKELSSDIHHDLESTIARESNFVGGYRTFDQVRETLEAVVAAHPDLAQVETIGVTAGGRPQLALKLSDNVHVDEDEPELMITAATHGDELITTEVLLRLVEELMGQQGQDTRATQMVDNHEIYIVPVVNSDGFVAHSRYAEGVDPNRDYPWPEDPAKSSVSCIANMISFVQKHRFAGTVDLHAYGRLVMYPWAFTRTAPDAADGLIFDRLGQAMAELNQYTYGQISRVIYIAQGSSADYYYWKTGSLSYGIEIADSKVPPVVEIPEIVTESREMMYRFIEHF
jgi:hypothetical protein